MMYILVVDRMKKWALLHLHLIYFDVVLTMEILLLLFYSHDHAHEHVHGKIARILSLFLFPSDESHFYIP
jgi:hypothetical protein